MIALRGDLGAGKTTLARAVLHTLGLEGEAPSPTFAIVQPYAPPEVSMPVWHVDLYRLEHPSEAEELGLDETRADAALLVEWPDRLGSDLWEDALLLDITAEADDPQRPGARRLTVSVPPSWEDRWPPR